MISAVGIKRILFADIDKVTADITPEIAKTLIQAAIKAKDEGRLRRVALGTYHPGNQAAQP